MKSPYARLGIAIAINTVIMFFLTYALLDSFDHFYVNVNRVYMALLMAAPMVIVMLVVMRSMYADTRMNAAIVAGAVLVFAGALAGMRTQTPVGDDQFLRSMIPHHSSAIVMCEEASISDPEIEELCDEIVETQKREIAEMKALLDD